jgi:hypothetical protein
LREDARYKGVARAEREQVFNEFIAKWKGEKQPDVEVRRNPVLTQSLTRFFSPHVHLGFFVVTNRGKVRCC